MRELLLKNKKGFAKYLFATFLFIIDHFVQIGFCALLMGAMEKGDVAYYNQFLFVVVAVAVYSPISFIVSRLLRIGYMRDTILTVRKQAFGKLMRMPFKKFSRQSKETYLSNLVNDINDFENRFFVSLLNFLINVGMFVLTFVVLCFVDWIMALAMIALSGILFGISRLLAKKTETLQKEVSEQSEQYTTDMSNTFNGLEILKLNRIEDTFLQKSLSSMKRMENKKFAMNIFSESQRNVIYSLGFVVQVLVMTYLCIIFKDGGISLGMATLVYQLGSSMSYNLLEAFPLWNVIKASVKIYDKITKDEEEGETVTEAAKTETSEFTHHMAIKVEDVTFSYEKNTVLEHVSFEIEKGKKYLIKGASGAGKSTLMNLLSMTYDDYTGKITADGVDYHEIKDKTFHEKAAFIFQDVFLFEDTLRNNISLYKELPEERVQTAASLCGLDLVIEERQEGLDMQLLENGKNLSGGQRQRIAIARAIAKEAEILFIDEGTSALNVELGSEIEKAFLSLDKTVIAVSHRYYEGVTNHYDYVLEVKNKRVKRIPAEEYFREEEEAC